MLIANPFAEKFKNNKLNIKKSYQLHHSIELLDLNSNNSHRINIFRLQSEKANFN